MPTAADRTRSLRDDSPRTTVDYEPLHYEGQHEAIPVTVYGQRVSPEGLVPSVTNALLEHPGTSAILLANHGLLVWGPSARNTAQLLVTIEEAAAIILRAHSLGGPQPLNL